MVDATRSTPRLPLAARLALVYLVSAAALAALMLPLSQIFAWDGLYHIKFAYLLRTQSLTLELRWLPFTIAGELGVDHHWLFHVLLIPFTFGDLVSGLKWAMVIYGALALTVFYWVLLRLRVPWASLFLLLVVASGAPFVLRLVMGRAGTVALPLMLLFVLFLRESRWLALAATTYVLTLAYGITIVLGPMALIALAVQYALERRVAWRALLYTAFGILLGLLANPYFPNNFEFMLFISLFKFSASTTGVRIGNEWAPYDTWNALSLFWPLWLAIAGSLVHSLARRTRWSLDSWTFFAVFGFFLFFFLRHSRFFEYAVPFGALFVALYWRDALTPSRDGAEATPREPNERPTSQVEPPASQVEPPSSQIEPPSSQVEPPTSQVEPPSSQVEPPSSQVEPPASQVEPASHPVERTSRRIVALVAAALVGLVALCFVGARDGIRRFGTDPHQMRDEAEWLTKNTPKDSIVFNLRYDTFPYLFLHNHHNRYVTGLEPFWLRYSSPKRFALYNAMVWSGHYPGDYVTTIRKEFQSRYVVGPRSKALFKHFRKKGFLTRLIGRGGFVLEAPTK